MGQGAAVSLRAHHRGPGVCFESPFSCTALYGAACRHLVWGCGTQACWPALAWATYTLNTCVAPHTNTSSTKVFGGGIGWLHPVAACNNQQRRTNALQPRPHAHRHRHPHPQPHRLPSPLCPCTQALGGEDILLDEFENLGLRCNPATQLVVTCEVCRRPATKECWTCSMQICEFCTLKQHWKVGGCARRRRAFCTLKQHWKMGDGMQICEFCTLKQRWEVGAES